MNDFDTGLACQAYSVLGLQAISKEGLKERHVCNEFVMFVFYTHLANCVCLSMFYTDTKSNRLLGLRFNLCQSEKAYIDSF